MKTVHANAEVEIQRPAPDVWTLVSDYDSDTRWRKGIREMTPDVPGEPKVGTNVREVLHLGGRDYVTETTVTEVGPGLSYRFAGNGDSGQVRGRRSVRAGSRPGSAVFAYDIELVPDALPAFARPVLLHWLRRSLRRDLRRLRTLAEAD
jgi:hypothetical protein